MNEQIAMDNQERLTQLANRSREAEIKNNQHWFQCNQCNSINGVTCKTGAHLEQAADQAREAWLKLDKQLKFTESLEVQS